MVNKDQIIMQNKEDKQSLKLLFKIHKKWIIMMIKKILKIIKTQLIIINYKKKNKNNQ